MMQKCTQPFVRRNTLGSRIPRHPQLQYQRFSSPTTTTTTTTTTRRSGSQLTPFLLGGGGVLPFAWFSAAAYDKHFRNWSHDVLRPFYGVSERTDALVKLFETRSREQSCAKLAYYGASILSFMGAIHWGAALVSTSWSARSRAISYTISTVPSLVAWGSLASISDADDESTRHQTCQSALAVQAIGFASLFWYDLVTISNGKLPRWYISLRIPLTIGAVTSLVLPVMANQYTESR